MMMDAEFIEEPWVAHFEYWARNKALIHLPAVRNAMGFLLMPRPEYDGRPLVGLTHDGLPDFETAYRFAVADLDLDKFH